MSGRLPINNFVSSNKLENVIYSAHKLGRFRFMPNKNKEEVNISLARGDDNSVGVLDQSAAFDTIDHGTLLDCLTGSSLSSLIILSVSRLVLFYLMLKSFCLECYSIHTTPLSEKLSTDCH